MIRRGNSSSNDSVSLCGDSTLSCCTSDLVVTTILTFSRPASLCLKFPLLLTLLIHTTDSNVYNIIVIMIILWGVV